MFLEALLGLFSLKYTTKLKKNMQQIPNLTSLRFILALLVVIFHTPEFFANRNLPYFKDYSLFLRGNESVWIFFSLSGFLIIRQLFNEKIKTNSINLKRFFLNRIYRIFPLYYLVLIFGFIHYQIILPKLGFQFENSYNILEGILLSVTFFSNIFLTYSPGGIIEILWSIGIEEQFYIVIAPLFYFIPKSKLKTTLILLTVVYLLLFISNMIPLLTEYKMYFFFFTFSGLCSVYFEKTHFNKLFSYSIYFLTIIYFLSNFFKNNLSENQYYVFSMILFGLFLSVLSKKPIFILENRALKYLGTISYSIYMLHAIAIQIVGLVYIKLQIENKIPEYLYIFSYTFLIILLTIIMAHISYKYYESYFLKFKKKLQHTSNRQAISDRQ
jgi:peptidoglycan/LPS O-acetylase OafA/YrhL